MSAFYFYLISGVLLIALEIATTTFYLLVIGIAFIVAGGIDLAYHSLMIATVCAGLLSIVGCFLVYLYKPKNRNSGKLLINHIGQEVEVIEVLPTFIKVRYSGSFWNAVVKDKDLNKINVGDRMIICKFNNNELEVK